MIIGVYSIKDALVGYDRVFTEKTLTSLNHYDILAIAERSKQEASAVLLRKLDSKGGKCYDAF